MAESQVMGGGCWGSWSKSQERSSTLGVSRVLLVLLDYDYDDGGCHLEGPHCICIWKDGTSISGVPLETTRRK